MRKHRGERDKNRTQQENGLPDSSQSSRPSPRHTRPPRYGRDSAFFASSLAFMAFAMLGRTPAFAAPAPPNALKLAVRALGRVARTFSFSAEVFTVAAAALTIVIWRRVAALLRGARIATVPVLLLVEIWVAVRVSAWRSHFFRNGEGRFSSSERS